MQIDWFKILADFQIFHIHTQSKRLRVYNIDFGSCHYLVCTRLVIIFYRILRSMELKCISVLTINLFLCFYSVIQHFLWVTIYFVLFFSFTRMYELYAYEFDSVFVVCLYSNFIFQQERNLLINFKVFECKKKYDGFISNRLAYLHSTWLNWSAIFVQLTSMWVFFMCLLAQFW